MLRPRSEWPYLRLGLRISQLTELSSHAARDRGRLAARLKTGEIRPVAPGKRPAQPDTGFERGIMDDVDRALVVGRPLAVPGKIAEVAARGEDRGHARDLGDLVGVLQPFG